MSSVNEEVLREYLRERFDTDRVELTDLVEHVEGWSRDTVSFTVRRPDDGEDTERRLVLRKESDKLRIFTNITPYATDIEDEYRTMEAAQQTSAPIPETYWFESDPSVLGGRFFVMEHRGGDAPVTWKSSVRKRLYRYWDEEDHDLPQQFVEAAVGIHQLGPQEVPFLEPTPPEEVVERELSVWERIYHENVLIREPAVEEALRWFRNNPPSPGDTTLVHGDFRIGNMLLEEDTITAVLDWELARVGDPLYDLGYASIPYFAGKLIEPIERPELACAVAERDWLLEEYERRSGRSVDRERVRYWQAFGAFVMMTISLAGLYSFYESEAEDVREAWLQYTVPGLIEDIMEIVIPERLKPG